MDVIPDLIDAGLDILNPIQTRAAGMDPAVLKERFGDKLIFWGGVDEQVLLPQGTPAQVRAEAERLSRTLGASGGYVLAASHNIQADTPSENILAIYR
jgi:uroporphyrinogen decarboxylase